MGKVLKIGLVGLGNIGKRHLTLLNQISEFQLVAICDVDAQILESFQETSSYTDYVDFLKYCREAEADIIVIATPHFEHTHQSIEALKMGFHVLVEKPMALTSSDALLMNNVAKEYNRKLWVVKQNRFNAPVAKVNELITSGILGKIFHLQCQVIWNRHAPYYLNSNWRGNLDKEGGALYTHASHFVDLMTWWAGNVVSAKGLMKRFIQPIETEDLGSSVLEFESGAMGSLTWTTLSNKTNQEGSITILAEKGTIKIGGLYLNQFDYWNVEGMSCPTLEELAVDLPNDYGNYQGSSSNHHFVYHSIAQELIEGKGWAVDGQEGLKSIVAIEKIYQAVR
jgi:predicted dehydrogenase